MMAPFPTAAPFRVDQVSAAPLAMTALFLVQPLLAAGMGWAAERNRPRWWWLSAALLVLMVSLFFTLASWGNSDTTKLSHYFAIHRADVEPAWKALAPLVLLLPWRMALVHGLVAGGYAAAVILLARQWQAPAWGGWWSLLLCCSPLLRGFLQNAHTRQALSTLLLLPVLLWAARLGRPRPLGTAISTLLAALTHTTFPFTLPLSLLPRLLGPWSSTSPLATPRQRDSLPATLSPPRLLALVVAVVAGGLMLALVVTIALHKLGIYSERERFFNSYALVPAVGRVQLAMALGVALTIWQRRLGWRALLACGRSRQLAAYALLYGLIQQSVALGWQPQITSRLADGVGFFLLIVWLGWQHHHHSAWAVLPALVVTLDYWVVERLLGSHNLSCGLDDAFLCVPDRWPWQLRYS